MGSRIGVKCVEDLPDQSQTEYRAPIGTSTIHLARPLR